MASWDRGRSSQYRKVGPSADGRETLSTVRPTRAFTPSDRAVPRRCPIDTLFIAVLFVCVLVTMIVMIGRLLVRRRQEREQWEREGRPERPEPTAEEREQDRRASGVWVVLLLAVPLALLAIYWVTG